jgi:hypothetical protein
MADTQPHAVTDGDEWEFPSNNESPAVPEKPKRNRPSRYKVWNERLRELNVMDVQAEIGRMWLRGSTLAEIASHFDIPFPTVQVWVNKCRAAWKDRTTDDMYVELAKVDELEAFAWKRLEESLNPDKSQRTERELSEATQKFVERKKVLTKTRSNGSTQWAAVIQWCVDYRTKVKGGYAPDRLRIEGEFRVAGQSRDDFYRELAGRIQKAAGVTN